MRHVHTKAPRAFTLVELLVVIGIIAVLVGILLPTLSRARQQGNMVKCRSNLKTIAQAALGYAAENRGSFPWGFTWVRTNDTQGGLYNRDPAAGWISWFTLTNHYMDRRGGDPRNINSGTMAANRFRETTYKLSDVFRCPEVPSNFQQQVNYYNNPVVMTHLDLEVRATVPPGSPNGFTAWKGPARVEDTFGAETAILWDTPAFDFPTVGNQRADRVGYPLLPYGDTAAAGMSGWISLIASQIDGGQLEDPNRTSLRFRNPRGRDYHEDATRGGVDEDPTFLALKQSINFPTIRFLLGAGEIGVKSFNTDVAGNEYYSSLVGQPRWRHNKNQVCNVAFADGHVDGLKLNPNRTIGGGDGYDTDFKRYMIMVKFPSGVPALNKDGLPEN